jgi:hypothetical protein
MIFRLGKSIATIVPFTRYDNQKPALPKKEIFTTKLIIMMAVIAIVIAIAVFVTMQVVYGQEQVNNSINVTYWGKIFDLYFACQTGLEKELGYKPSELWVKRCMEIAIEKSGMMK